MPELPEVETLKMQLAKVLLGQVINRVEIKDPQSWQGDPQKISGLQVSAIYRRGKVLIINLTPRQNQLRKKPPSKPASEEVLSAKRDQSLEHPPLFPASAPPFGLHSADLSLVIHLKMTGQLIFEPHGVGDPSHLLHRLVGGHPTGDFVGQLPSPHTRVIFYFADGGVLYFNDQRKFGWIRLVPTHQVDRLDFLARLGPEPDKFSSSQWLKTFSSTKKAVKLLLMDQNNIAGLGNIYANDALWEARLDPRRPASSLTPLEAKKLHQAVLKVLGQGIKFGGATAADGKYLDLQGLGGHYQEHFKVYQRQGQPCLRRDGGTVRRINLGGRGTFWCPICQK